MGVVGQQCISVIDEERRQQRPGPKSKIAARVLTFIQDKKEADQCVINLVENLLADSPQPSQIIIPKDEHGKRAYLFFLQLAQRLVPGDDGLKALYQQFSDQMGKSDFENAQATMDLIKQNLQAKAGLVADDAKRSSPKPDGQPVSAPSLLPPSAQPEKILVKQLSGPSNSVDAHSSTPGVSPQGPAD